MRTAKEIIKELKFDFKKYAVKCLKVRDHNTAKIMPFTFRPGQNVTHDIAEKRKKEMGYGRFLLLKNRRFGGSTYISGRGYHRTTFNFNQNAFIIGHETDSTTTLYRMVQLFQEQNPISPDIITSNANELRFDNPKGTGLKSEYRLATAKNVEAGRSQGIHYLHCSECAMWPSHTDELLTSLFQCIPRPPADSEIWIESTGRGYGNWFQRTVFKTYAEGKYAYFTALISEYAPHMPHADIEFTFAYHNPETEWILIFVPWFLDPSCQREFIYNETEEEFVAKIVRAKNKVDDINHEALKLQKKYKLTNKQLYWREWSIKNECNDDISFFQQENPLTVEEAFRTEGSNLYNAEFCNMVERNCCKPIVVGNIIRRMGMPVIEPFPKGHLSIWERYSEKEQYFLTVDAAGGKREIHQTEDREPDNTVIDVWNHRTGNQAAQWYGHVDYDMISDVVKMIGEMYGKGIACIELNNTGYKVVGDLKGNYPLFNYKPGEAGWSTNKKTKGPMALDLLDGCRSGQITIRCKETVSEMRTFIEKDSKYGAEAGCNDDRVISAQLAVQMMDRLKLKKNSEKKEYDTDNIQESTWMVA